MVGKNQPEGRAMRRLDEAERERRELAEKVASLQAEADSRILRSALYGASRQDMPESAQWDAADPLRPRTGLRHSKHAPGVWLSRPDDYLDGRCLPLYHNELDLEELRGRARWLAATSETTQAILQSLEAYTIGEGLTYTFEARGRNVDPGLVASLQGFLDAFLEANDWTGEGEVEAFRSAVVDGDHLLWLREDDVPRVVAIGAEHISEPGAPREVEDYYGLDREPLSWTFGVATPEGDTAEHVGYFVDWFGRGGSDWEFVPAGDAVFLKRNVPRQCKRGVSDFVSPYQTLHRASELSDRIMLQAAIQASISLIRKVGGDVSQQAIQDALDRSGVGAKITGFRADGQRARVDAEYFMGGRLITTTADYLYGPMGSPSGPAFIDVLQSGLRMAGSRWLMPEYMVSGDASNANYASTLAATSPFVLRTRREQGWYCRSMKRLVWRAVEMAHAANGWPDQAGLRQLVELRVEAPEPSVQDREADERVRDAQQRAGVLSAKTRAAQSGLDYEQEVASGARAEVAQPAPVAESLRPAVRFSLLETVAHGQQNGVMENCGTGDGGFQPGNTCAASGSLADTAIAKGWSKKVLRQKAEAAGLNPDDVQRIRAEKERERNPRGVTAKQSDEERAAARAEREAQAAASAEAERAAARAVTAQTERLRNASPKLAQEAEAGGMMVGRTAKQVERYVDAAISWESADPSRAAVGWAVAELKRDGAKLVQRGNNNSWYGKTADGRDVRVSDHVGKEPHEVDIILDVEAPPTREQAARHLADQLGVDE